MRSALATLRPVVADDAPRPPARGARRLDPLQRIEQVDFDELGRPVMLSSEWHVPDVFELSVNRMSDAAAGSAGA